MIEERKSKMGKTIHYGIFGTGEVERDDNGYIELPIVIQESGLYVGAPPPELRIRDIFSLSRDDPEFNKQWVAKLNRRTNLPFCLGKAKIKVVGKMIEITDADLLAEGIKPLED
jgi:hypothetical protein